jgi:hypothetical protein
MCDARITLTAPACRVRPGAPRNGDGRRFRLISGVMLRYWCAMVWMRGIAYPPRLAPGPLAAAIAMSLCLLLAVAPVSRATAPVARVAAEAAQSVAVTVSGSIPGIREQDLAAYVAGTMNVSHIAPWHFEPARPAVAEPGYRITWTFKENSYAAGTVRTYGFSRAMMQRLIGSRSFISIEGKLFLNDEYQTAVLGNAMVSGGARSSELGNTIAELTRKLMAYPQLDTTGPAEKP